MRLTIANKTLKTKHLKKVAVVVLYSLIVLVMIVGTAAPAFMGY